MRILTIADHLGARSGTVRNQLAVCRCLTGRGHRVDLVYAHGGDVEEEWRTATTSMTHVSDLPRPRAPLTTIHSMFGTAQGVRGLQPDVVYVHHYLDLPLAGAVGRLAGVPVVLHLGRPPPDHLPFAVRHGLTYPTLTLAVSFDTAARWRGSPLAADSVVVVHTGVDMDTCTPATDEDRRTTRSELGIGPDTFLVLAAGRLSTDKGLPELMEAARLLAARLPAFQLVVAGGPSVDTDPAEATRFRSELDARAGHLDIRWLGWRDDIVRLLGAADVVVVPSTWPEPFSRTIIEALACGVPVVATDVGGTPEILEGWLGRFMVPARDPATLARAIAELEGWRGTDPGLGARCRSAVVDRLPLERQVDTVKAALASVARFTPADTAPPVGLPY